MSDVKLDDVRFFDVAFFVNQPMSATLFATKWREDDNSSIFLDCSHPVTFSRVLS